ncbi:hypothetical protein ACQP2T_44805 [Nonomuraea sp. CA-143628]
MGGTLMWSTPNGSIRWQLPTKNTGVATHKALLDAIKDYRGE